MDKLKEEPKEETRDRREIALDEFLEVVRQSSYKAGAVLDVGCSDDYNKERIEGAGMAWLGMDKIAGKNVFIKGVMENIPLHDGIMTFIYCSHVFEHTINPLQTLREFKRVLCAGGLVFLVTPEPIAHQIFTMDKTHYFVLNINQIVSLLQKSGFAVIRSLTIKDVDGFNNLIVVAGAIG